MNREIRVILYLVLIGYSINAFLKLLDYPTAIEETEDGTAIYPDITICSYQSTEDERNIRSFSDILKAIEQKKNGTLAMINILRTAEPR